ncbi:MAG: hypothetical protein NC084_05960 [Bacteroides sp.]|nr:hypothetical protein [Eubacterium sp.]MCM1418131.1 hypothetical protein [Roseburia sp.]MCM1462244.1 hypothetical protein [Bacteroides sp.]
MKSKRIYGLLTAALLMFSCGCDQREEERESAAIETFIYEKASAPTLIAAAGETLYTLRSDESNASLFTAYDRSGEPLWSAAIPELSPYDVKAICADENAIYAAIDGGRGITLSRIELGSGSVAPITELEGLSGLDKLGVCDGKLYWIGKGTEPPKSVDPFVTEEGVAIYFEDAGKEMGCFDLNGGESTVSEFEFPVSFAVSGETVTVYGYDSEGGYYFADHAKPNSKKYTNKLGLFTSFEYYGEDGAFAFIGANDFTGVLPVSKADGESGVIRAVKGVYPFFPSDICASEAGYVWLKTADSALSAEKKIKRYDLSDTVIQGNPIRVISSQYFVEQPFGAGSEIQLSQLSGEGFALTVLSLDKSYDAAMIGSDQGIASDVKTKGSFYPLNDVPGVSDYLDRCFPYIREAVTDEDGNICMLPVMVEIPLIVYHEKNCAESGIVLSLELEPFIQAVKRASDVSEYYGCSRYQLVNSLLAAYLTENRSFDTEEFRRLAALIKEQCAEDIFKGNFELYSALLTAQSDTENRYYTRIYEQTLFTQLQYRFQQLALIGDEDLRAAPMPLSGKGKSFAVCTFLCVNPYSDRLSETLAFLENTVSAMSAERNSFMLADPATYEDTPLARDLYAIYQNGVIGFQFPSEIYAADFERYCADEITLEELIAEADRKLSAYLNE